VRRILAVLQLAGWFGWGVVASGTHTTWVILAGRSRPRPMLARVGFAPMSETGVAVFASLITLTPGSTVVDVDAHRREFLVHLLDGAGAPKLITSMRHHFEGPLATLFARGDA
jgi:multicomponent K+:H+ antiporter subunit E